MGDQPRALRAEILILYDVDVSGSMSDLIVVDAKANSGSEEAILLVLVLQEVDWHKETSSLYWVI
jgi:hypothetical protein